MPVYQSECCVEDAHDFTQRVKALRPVSAFMLPARGTVGRDPGRLMCRLVGEQAAGRTTYRYRVCLTSQTSGLLSTRNTSRVITCYVTSIMP
jgi:hypothetical protein